MCIIKCCTIHSLCVCERHVCAFSLLLSHSALHSFAPYVSICKRTQNALGYSIQPSMSHYYLYLNKKCSVINDYDHRIDTQLLAFDTEIAQSNRLLSHHTDMDLNGRVILHHFFYRQSILQI